MTMRTVSSDAGYGWVSKALHWLVVLAMSGQFVLGYGMEALSEGLSEDGGGGGHRGRSDGGGGRDGDDLLVFAHAWVGGGILVLGLLRLAWRLGTPLPPWSARLGPRDRVVQTWTERGLLSLTCLVPLSGLALLFLSGEDRDIGNDREWQPPFELMDDDALLAVHVACHIAFYVVVAVHIGLVLRRRTLARML